MKNKSWELLVSLVLGAAYALYSVVYWFGSDGAASSNLGGALAAALVMPHLVVMFMAVLFNALGLSLNKSSFALVAGILYAVSMALFIAYFTNVICQTVLCFVAYARMHGREKRAEADQEEQPQA